MSTLAFSPNRARLLAAARDVGPLLEKHAGESERERRLAVPAVEAMLDAGLFQCATPRELNGSAADPLTQLEVFETVAAADTAAAWNLMNGTLITGFLGSRLELPALDAVFRAEAWPISAGHTAPLGRAASSDDGYRLAGRWRFGSGIHQAAWVIAGCHVYDGEVPRTNASGNPQRWLGVVPIAAVSIEDHAASSRYLTAEGT